MAARTAVTAQDESKASYTYTAITQPWPQHAGENGTTMPCAYARLMLLHLQLLMSCLSRVRARTCSVCNNRRKRERWCEGGTKTRLTNRLYGRPTDTAPRTQTQKHTHAQHMYTCTYLHMDAHIHVCAASRGEKRTTNCMHISRVLDEKMTPAH